MLPVPAFYARTLQETVVIDSWTSRAPVSPERLNSHGFGQATALVFPCTWGMNWWIQVLTKIINKKKTIPPLNTTTMLMIFLY